MISNDMIKGEIEFYEDMQRSLSVKQRGLPKGNIYFKQEHGRKRPYVRIDGKEKYLSTQDIKTIRGLMSRAEIERALKLIGQNMLLLEGMQGNFVDLSEIIPETYAFPDTGLSKYKISKISDQWAEQRRTDRLPAELFVGESLNYEEEGFWPFKNLITTFEFGDGDLDVMEIGRILKMMQVI